MPRRIQDIGKQDAAIDQAWARRRIGGRVVFTALAWYAAVIFASPETPWWPWALGVLLTLAVNLPPIVRQLSRPRETYLPPQPKPADTFDLSADFEEARRR